jgi:hypothetical protein
MHKQDILLNCGFFNTTVHAGCSNGALGGWQCCAQALGEHSHTTSRRVGMTGNKMQVLRRLGICGGEHNHKDVKVDSQGACDKSPGGTAPPPPTGSSRIKSSSK